MLDLGRLIRTLLSRKQRGFELHIPDSVDGEDGCDDVGNNRNPYSETHFQLGEYDVPKILHENGFYAIHYSAAEAPDLCFNFYERYVLYDRKEKICVDVSGDVMGYSSVPPTLFENKAVDFMESLLVGTNRPLYRDEPAIEGMLFFRAWELEGSYDSLCGRMMKLRETRREYDVAVANLQTEAQILRRMYLGKE
ncbi:MAG: hypothetical protein A2912_01255 [Candidatus Buchananbacteria bacterium RIFCSPLOWO2_01_FULL_40_23b]|uniref:Uncharacterized protein n=1 Tax=Candidatus Buchananbacteria bacterium RIFCSPLOWO2_01_FULL_40_23b TaxID=1797544 RepID=A0A1G1YVX0_9BACT|nr:MAG: hypothetical protein A2912_01255 [Candidatus Buchananbacteria bacterium RIFCSPLOWO2_01_FULL_40_23b]